MNGRKVKNSSIETTAEGRRPGLALRNVRPFKPRSRPSKPCFSFLLSLYAITEWSRSFGYFMASPLLGWGDFGDPTYGAFAGLPDGAFPALGVATATATETSTSWDATKHGLWLDDSDDEPDADGFGAGAGWAKARARAHRFAILR